MRTRLTAAQLITRLAIVLFAVVHAPEAAAQTSPGVPTLIPLSGELRLPDGQPRSGTVLLVISLYEGQADTAPRWIEHQPVTLDPAGRYNVQFGATLADGLPAELFAGPTGTRWVGVAVENEPEHPRVTLVSVPYAAKAVSADTLAGKPATDFVLTSTLHDDVRAVLQEEGVTSGSNTPAAVTLNYLQKGNGSGGTTDSGIFEAANGNIGIGTTTPGANLHIVGSTRFGTNDHSTGGGALVDGVIKVAWGTGVPAPAAGLWSLWHESTDGSFRFKDSGGDTNVVFDDNGTVGIGVASPGRQLDIAGSARARGYFEISESDGSRNGLFVTYKALAGAGTDRSPTLFAETGNGLYFATNGSATRAMAIDPNGNVGIGTSTPLARLHVAGAATVTGDLTVNGNIAAKYQDVAEWVDATGPFEAGTIVIIDPSATNRVMAAARQYDARVAGAVSPQPGLTLGEPGEGKALIAQSGRVRIKADAGYGAIRPGDLLVTSATQGHAMRSDPKKVRPGTVIGKALEALPAGRGEILALLTLQ